MIPDRAFVNDGDRAELAELEDHRVGYVAKLRALRLELGTDAEGWDYASIDTALRRAVAAGVSYADVEDLLEALAFDPLTHHPGRLATPKGRNRARVLLYRRRHAAGIPCGVAGCEVPTCRLVAGYCRRARELCVVAFAPWRVAA